MLNRQSNHMKILSIDTSCDETAASVTEDASVLSSLVWSQASLHAKFGGIYPSLAKREHEERIDFVIEKALKSAFPKLLVPKAYSLVPKYIDAIAVTVGPGLAIALEVGIKKAKELSEKYNLPLITVNHVEGHLLSSLANSNSKIEGQNSRPKADRPLDENSKLDFPAFGLVVSGGTTQLIQIERIGTYKIIANTQDDALGEALDKAARMLGLGYPGGAILEIMARKGNPKVYNLPIPLLGQEKRLVFSYSGLKTAMYKLVESEKPLTKDKIQNLAASFQNVAFEHLIRILRFVFNNRKLKADSCLLVGGGVGANVELRKRIRKLCKGFNITPLFPYSQKLYGDNAAMIGVAAYFKTQRNEFEKDITKIERLPQIKVSESSS